MLWKTLIHKGIAIIVTGFPVRCRGNRAPSRDIPDGPPNKALKLNRREAGFCLNARE